MPPGALLPMPTICSAVTVIPATGSSIPSVTLPVMMPPRISGNSRLSVSTPSPTTTGRTVTGVESPRTEGLAGISKTFGRKRVLARRQTFEPEMSVCAGQKNSSRRSRGRGSDRHPRLCEWPLADGIDDRTGAIERAAVVGCPAWYAKSRSVSTEPVSISCRPWG